MSDEEAASASIAVEVNTAGDVKLNIVPEPLDPSALRLDEASSADNAILAASDLSDPCRRIWIVTTAGLPWRTGTAVNPLLRALQLASTRPAAGMVTLMIPWLEHEPARRQLYGADCDFQTSADQEAWIRKYCMERCGASEQTTAKLGIQFWQGLYQESFGSIFPTEDICSTIPREEADICILEEPEHLNWFRVPAKRKPPPSVVGSPASETATTTLSGGDDDEADDDTTTTTNIEILGWAHKFQWVVGILHTNYADYIRQYGMATLLTAPALNSLSSLVVKAYCHRVIRLSATLPHLDPTKEITCNVHGVRHEFLERQEEQTESVDDEEETETPPSSQAVSNDDADEGGAAAVYFVGKLIWAKGFENLLELQEKYKAATGDYFCLDIYGGGKDEKEMKKAFFGRNHGDKPVSRSGSSVSLAASDSSADQKAAAVFRSGASLRDQLCGTGDTVVDDDGYIVVAAAADRKLCGASVNTVNDDSDMEVQQPATPSCNAAADGTTSVSEMLATPKVDTPSPAAAVQPPTQQKEDDTTYPADAESSAPLEILGDLSEKTLSTTVDTADAALKLIESVLSSGFGLRDTVVDESQLDKPQQKSRSPLSFHIASAKTRFKWRRNPIPARFLGVQDHIIVRDMDEHKIFLNMSTSEVLCTTSAEALAMGKFVILPKHPSNDFFMQFPNCLAYESISECVEKLQYALETTPNPLSEEHVHMLSWEGATERLIKAAAITKKQAAERKAQGLDKEDVKAARFHAGAAKKSQNTINLFRGKILKSK